MLLEPKEQFRLIKEQLDKNKNNKLNLEQIKLNNYFMPDISNRWKNKKCFKNKPEPKKQSFNLLSVNKDK